MASMSGIPATHTAHMAQKRLMHPDPQPQRLPRARHEGRREQSTHHRTASMRACIQDRTRWHQIPSEASQQACRREGILTVVRGPCAEGTVQIHTRLSDAAVGLHRKGNNACPALFCRALLCVLAVLGPITHHGRGPVCVCSEVGRRGRVDDGGIGHCESLPRRPCDGRTRPSLHVIYCGAVYDTVIHGICT